MENKEAIQITDPEVTQKKFNAELQKFLAVEDRYWEKGVICTRAIFPNIYFIFGVPKLTPQPIVFSVEINFTNYDFTPPSVRFINPFTFQLLRRDQIPIAFIQVNPHNLMQPLDLLQGQGEMTPFFCIPGIKEYHDHPAHSGDSWFLYRKRGEGQLLFILDQLYNHSIPGAKSYQVNVNIATIRIQQEIIVPGIQVKEK